MVVPVSETDSLVFTPLIDNLNFVGKQLIVPTRSGTMVECFAIDWLIVNMELERVGIFTSPSLINPLVQQNAYSSDPAAPLTTAMELFADKSRDWFVVQIRSEIPHGGKFSDQFSKFLKSSFFANVVILTGSDSCYLFGADLEQPRVTFASDSAGVVNGGLAKRICEKIENRELVVATTRGRGADEIVLVSRELALACAKKIGKSSQMSLVPPSIAAIV